MTIPGDQRVAGARALAERMILTGCGDTLVPGLQQSPECPRKGAGSPAGKAPNTATCSEKQHRLRQDPPQKLF